MPSTQLPGGSNGSEINAKHQVSQQHAISNSGGESEGLVKDLCVLWITALKRDRHAELIFQKKRSLQLMHFEVVDLLRGGVVPNITNDINLPKGDFFVFEFQFKVSSMICASCPCLVNKDLHPPIHKNIFFQPLLRSGQALLQRVVWILRLLPTVLSAVVFHILFQVFVL